MKLAEEDFKRYSIEQIREMNKRGEARSSPPDGVVADLDEDFWRELEGTRPLPNGSSEMVELVLPQATVASFAEQGADYQAEMARVLEAYAAAKAKKAS